MKRLFFSLCAVGLSCAAFGAGPEVNIVPKPLSVTPGAGTFTVTASTVIGVGKNAELRRSARIFAGEVAPVVGGVMKTAAEGDVRLAVDGSLEAEAYTLAVTPSGVEVRGGTPQGVFHGLQSLRQLVIDGEGVVPAVTVSDKPYFAHRGGMLDPCRHFWTVDEVKEYIDILAMHKLNKFHWHLTDDQGWRIEIKKYPELTRVGSVRGETLIGHHHTSSEYDKTPHGGYYTQKQIREIVKYAADRYVTVIPEIELPGHAVAALTSYPWLGCKGEGYEVRRRWGISKEVFCPGKETTFEFLQNVFAEVLELFPSEFIHIGGDECPKDSWKQCPLCQERIRTEGLKDEFELQSYTVRRMEKWLREHGRKIIGWDEILEGGVSHGDRHVVARLEGRHCGGQGRQPRHHGAQCPLLPGLLPDQDPGEGADGHRRLCPDAQGLRTGPLRPAYARRACLHPRRAGQSVDRVYRHVPAPEAHATAASGRHRRGGLVLRPQGFRRLQTPHELPAQVLRCRRAELRHLFLRRQGRIAVRSVKTSP